MKKFDFKISAQPDDTTCGPTCLHAIYRYLGLQVSLKDIILEIEQFNNGGGTLGVILAKHALKLGLDVKIYSYNLNVFDPSWFKLSKKALILKLEETLTKRENDKKYLVACKSYIDFLKLGGKLFFSDLSVSLIVKLLLEQGPILTGLSSTWLYQDIREDPVSTDYDDINGVAAGHFVVVHGLNRTKKFVDIADPHLLNPISKNNYYHIPIVRLMNAILLGVMSYDGNLILINKKKRGKK